MTTLTQDAGTDTTAAGGTQTAAPTEGTPTAAPITTEIPAEAETEYTFDAPDGVELNQDDLGKFTAIAKELKLPADAAKKLVDIAAAREVARVEAFAKQVETWGDEVKADKELGTAENLAIAKGAVEKFGDQETVDLLNSTGIGNHPVFVRLMLKVGRAISEDTIVNGRSDPASTKSVANILYGNTP